MLGLITPDGILRLAFVSPEFAVDYDGLLLDWIHPAQSSGDLQGEMSWLVQRGGDWMPLSYSGRFQPGEWIEISFAEGNGLSSLSLRPWKSAAPVVDGAMIEGLWRSNGGSGAPAVEWRIDPEGSFTGSDESGCEYQGMARVDAESNVLALSGTVDCDGGAFGFVGTAGLFQDAPGGDALAIVLNWSLVSGQDSRVDVLARVETAHGWQGGRGWLYAIDPTGEWVLRGELVPLESANERAHPRRGR